MARFNPKYTKLTVIMRDHGEDQLCKHQPQRTQTCDLCQENNLAFGGTVILVMALYAEGVDEDF